MAMSPRLLRPLAGFDPRRIAGLKGWWDADDSSTVTLDSGRVAALADKSGLNRNATNSTSGSTQPQYITAAVNGRNAIRFVALDATQLQFSNIAIPSSHTVLGVFTRPTASTHSFLLTNGMTGDTNVYSFWWFTDNVVYQNSNGNFTTHGTAIATTGSFAVAVRRTGTSSVLVRRNGTALENVTTGQAVTSPASGAWAFIGRYVDGTFMQGDICEIVLYDRALSDREIVTVEGYLARKWGIMLP